MAFAPVNGQVRVIVADDEPALRAALGDLIQREPDLELVGVAADADDALELIGATDVDVAIVDIKMPGGGGRVAREVRARFPSTRVVALSAYEDRATVIEMLRAGAVGYLLKGVPPNEILEGVRRAARSQASLSIGMMDDVIDALFGDIAEHRESEEVLRRSEERVRGLLESAPDAVVIADANGQISLINEQTERLFGYERDEVIGRKVELLLPERFRERHVEHRDDYLANPLTRPMGVGLELAGRRKDGSEFPVDISLSTIATEEGPLVTAFIRDTSERVLADEIRRRSEERFGTVLESAPDGVVIINEAGEMVLVNAQTERMFGYERSELLGQPVERLLPERFAGRHGGHRANYFGDPRTRPMGIDLDLAGRRKDGTEFPVDISLSAISTEEGTLATAFIRDTTERRRGERAIRQLAAIVESSDDAIIGKTLDGTIVSWNRGAERMYGYAADEVIGRSISVLDPVGEDDQLAVILERVGRGEQIEQLVVKRQRKDGTVIDASLNVSAIRDELGHVVGASTIAHDITHLRQQAALESEVEQRRALLAHIVAAGEEERSRIAADIHDDSIQAITAAGMRLQLLARAVEDPEHLALLADLQQTIHLSINRLRHLLFELRPPALDREGLVPALRMYLEELNGGVQYRLDDRLRAQPNEEARVILYRIAQEALTNVRKHSHAQTAQVVLSERDGGFVVRITDDGVGFAAGDMTPKPGHLGLAAMRERADLAGGWLRIDSAAQAGTTVECWIPQSQRNGVAFGKRGMQDGASPPDLDRRR